MSDEADVKLEADDVRNFWEERAKRFEKQDLVNLSNLEVDTALAREKHARETAVLQDYVNPQAGQVFLDLGAGHGAWSTTFAKTVAHVDAVEYAEGMVEIARQNIEAQGLDNVRLYHSAAQDFDTERRYDTVFLSGLTIYLNDAEFAQLLGRIQGYLRPSGRVILRDGTGKEEPYTIKNRYSEELEAYYSAHYRTAQQYIDWFQKFRLRNLRHQDMFPDGSVLNKRKETILRVYEFVKVGGA